ncbi:hypothetical protein Enr13x_01720 [Stieleria neptunia]|uniref:Uncharacterized protein n=1 Tax=Stieleria neptunia TaxID=2527979 RepID=A0A518HHP4_9BACT|nr:hypothetical protein Enr13x_01720 [Stieleria neptunia]
MMVRGQTPMVRGQTPMVRGQTPMVRGQTPMVWGHVRTTSNQGPHAPPGSATHLRVQIPSPLVYPLEHWNLSTNERNQAMLYSIESSDCNHCLI